MIQITFFCYIYRPIPLFASFFIQTHFRMDEWWKSESVLKYKNPTSIFIVGPSSSGKTVFTKSLLQNANATFEKPFSKMFYCYSIWQPIYDEMKSSIENIEFYKGFPDMDLLTEWGNLSGEKCLVIDDLLLEASDSKELIFLLTVGIHHYSLTLIFIFQSLYFKGKAMRTASLNCHYFILFKNYRDQLQIQTLGKQIFPGQSKYFMDAYMKATSVKYRPLIVDLNPHTNKMYQLSTNRGVGETPIIYQPIQ